MAILPVPAFEEFDARREGNPGAGARACVFLDRDGVVNRRRLLLVRRWGNFRFVPGVERALARLARLPVRIVVVTNQDTVGTGYIRETDLTGIHRAMVAAVRDVGGRIDAVYACVHPPWISCECRKPAPGMLHAAATRYGIEPERSWMIGDNYKDMKAGRDFGCRTVLVDPRLRTWWQGASRFADETFAATPAALESVAARIEKTLVRSPL